MSDEETTDRTKLVDGAMIIARLIDGIQRECSGDGNGAIAELVRSHSWKFEVKVADNGLIITGRPD